MKVFVTGGTGIIGKRLVSGLVELGHEVGVTVRNNEKAELVKSLLAIPHQINLFDFDQVFQAMTGYDAVIHLATAIPTKNKTKPQDWEMNNRLRTEGTEILLKASLKHNITLYIQESFVGVYGHRGGEILDEKSIISNPVVTSISIGPDYQKIFSSLVEMEKMVQSANSQGLPTIILRFGMFYAHDGSMIPEMATGKFPVVGKGENYLSLLSVDDASNAIIVGLTNHNGNTGKIFNIVENDVPTQRELLTNSSQNIGKKKASSVPKFLVRLLFGKFALNFLTTSARMSNQKAKNELGWQPKYHSYKEGISSEINQFNMVKNST